MERNRSAHKGELEATPKLKGMQDPSCKKMDVKTAIVAKALEIPLSLLPEGISTVLQKGYNYTGSLGVLKGTHEGTDDEWETEIGAITVASVRKEERLQDITGQFQGQELEFPLHADVSLTLDEQRAAVSKLVQRMNDDNQTHVRQAALAIYALMKYAERRFDPETVKKISDSFRGAQKKFQLDAFLQMIEVQVMSVIESHVQIPGAEKGFVYPAFQKGLPFYPDHGYQVTLQLAERQVSVKCAKDLLALVEAVDATCRSINAKANDPPRNGMTVNYADFNVGFEPTIWKQICMATGKPVFQPLEDAIEQLKPENNFVHQSSRLTYSEGDMWFYLKAESSQYCQEMLEVIEDPEKPWAMHFRKPILVTMANKKNDGRVLGGMFLDGIGSAVDCMSLLREVIVSGIPSDDSGHSCEGATFAFTQFFDFDLEALDNATQPDKEQMIGRDVYGDTIPRLQERSHIKRARVIRKKDGTNTELLRQALPYAHAKSALGPQEKGLFFVAFGKSIATFFEILSNLYGQAEPVFVKDNLLANAMGRFGCLLYCPSALELNLQPLLHNEAYPPIPFWMEFKSANPLLFYNHIQYLYTMTTNQYAENDPPTDRVLYLLSTVFARWQSTWFHKFDVPRLPHLRTFLSLDDAHIMEQPIQIRKGYSYKKMLGQVLTANSAPPGEIAYGTSENFDSYRLDPKELIVGVTDRLSFGSGKEVMPYLKEDEMNLSWSLGLTEAGNMGHIVPGHEIMLTKRVTGILNTLKCKQEEKDLTPDQITFLQAAIYAYEGVQLYLMRFALLAFETCRKLDPKSTLAGDRKNLRDIAHRMLKLALRDGEVDLTFHDAAQMIFSMHCCLHLVGQPVSVGRLDQLLIGYYQRDLKEKRITPERAQEIIDAFFIKFDEHVLLNRYNIPYGHVTYGSTAVTGRGGPFPTGDSLNQWIQQVTVGGYTREGAEGYNDVTLMCLKACRRLPLNAPCVSLRLTTNPPKLVVEEAAKALLSGGAHPILYNDDKMVEGLHKVLCSSYDKLNLPVPPNLLKNARDYSCDGCYEPMFTGASEFKFAYVDLLKAVMYALNSGGDYQAAGPLHLAGDASSWRTPLAKDITTFKEFQDIFLTHLRLLVENLFGSILSSYGNPWKICPSPMLSCLLANCLERATDMTNGGSRFHIMAPMYVGFANTVNSLYNVKQMVFDDVDNVATLETLTMALINNWGHSMCEPFFDTTGSGVILTDMLKQQFLDLREVALQLPKFGTDTANDELNDLALWLAKEMDTITHDVLYNGPLAAVYDELRRKFSTDDHPFVFQVMTGSGTFESYVSVGSSTGATPDGRLSGQPIASDCSPQPFPQDKPVPHTPPEKQLDIIDTLKPYSGLSKFIPNGCEVDIRIPESFPDKDLEEFIVAFAKGETGSNLVTVTCADNWTYEQAYNRFQQFDLVRNRMGGWSNFFVAMFTEHQKQHERRPLFRPHKSEDH